MRVEETRRGNKGKRRAKEDIWWTLRQRSTTKDNQWTHKRSASSEQTKPKCQTDEDKAVQSYAMKIGEKKSTEASR